MHLLYGRLLCKGVPARAHQQCEQDFVGARRILNTHLHTVEVTAHVGSMDVM